MQAQSSPLYRYQPSKWQYILSFSVFFMSMSIIIFLNKIYLIIIIPFLISLFFFNKIFIHYQFSGNKLIYQKLLQKECIISYDQIHKVELFDVFNLTHRIPYLKIHYQENLKPKSFTLGIHDFYGIKLLLKKLEDKGLSVEKNMKSKVLKKFLT